MPHPLQTPFAAVFRTEVLLNSKRLAPYVMALICGGNALLWWGWGPAAGRGVATNSDAFISGVLPIFSFMTLPLFTAVIMADPVIRDFRAEIDPLIFSKPVSRAEYLLGKFFGNFFVLACGQAAFVITLFVLQWLSRPGMVVQDVKVVPYVKHFLVFVVISHLVLAAFHFAAGTLTRNAKLVYGLGVCFYPLYISYQLFFLKGLPLRWQSMLDPLLMNWDKGKRSVHTSSPEWFNQLVITYDADLVINRIVMLLLAAGLLALVYRRFTIAERPHKVHFSALNLSTASERISFEPESDQDNWVEHDHEVRRRPLALPRVTSAGSGVRASFRKLVAALAIEFRLLLSERSLVVIMPLAVILSLLDVSFWPVTPQPSYSAAYATHTARSIFIFLVGIPIFYLGEAMHRDRDLKMEPLLWSQPTPNSVLLLSKFLSTLLLMFGLICSVGLIAIVVQIAKSNGPLELSAYARVYFLILVPNAIFVTATALILSVLLRDRYLFYAAAIGICVGLFYLYTQGYNGWLYNPLLYGLWSYVDLAGTSNNGATILLQRLYFLAIAVICLSLAHLLFQRKSATRLFVNRHPSDRGLSFLIALVSLTIAFVSAVMIVK
ncbi:MAG TPA: hypothetical protein VFH31_18670 [Pyrinomonadaceae bacterium]|nr:hypothetical protein [Pyrinomonadaceae bacterium]